jgi:hypothetical protein
MVVIDNCNWLVQANRDGALLEHEATQLQPLSDRAATLATRFEENYASIKVQELETGTGSWEQATRTHGVRLAANVSGCRRVGKPSPPAAF